MNKLDLGAVTAYAMAVEKGYKGTEEEFAALQAESGNNAVRAEAAADRAQQILDNIPLDFQEVSQGVATLAQDISTVKSDFGEGMWESGGLAGGLPVENSSRLRMYGIRFDADGILDIAVEPGYQFGILTLNDDGTYVDSGWIKEIATHPVDAAHLYAMQMSKTDASDISLAESENVKITLKNQLDGKLEKTEAYAPMNYFTVAHMLGEGLAPQNTLAALRAAAKAGFKYAEFDIHKTADNRFVVVHDGSVRVKNGVVDVPKQTTDYKEIEISQTTFNTLRGYDFGSWYSKWYTGEKIPSLEEVILFCKKADIVPVCEIKYPATASDVALILSTIAKFGMLKKTIFLTYYSSKKMGNWETMDALLAQASGCKIMGESFASLDPIEKIQEIVSDMKAKNAGGNELFMYVEPPTVENHNDELAALGVEIVVGVTNDISTYASMLDKCVSGIITKSLNPGATIRDGAIQ